MLPGTSVPDRPRRRRATRAIGIALAVACAALTACGGSDGGAGGSGPVTIGGTPRSTTAMLTANATNANLAEKFGVQFEYSESASVNVLYQEFTAGRYDCVLTDPGVFAAQSANGLPMTVVASVAPNFSYLLTRRDSGITGPKDLVGKRLVATTATGGYKFFNASVKEWYGVDLDTQVEIVQAQTDLEGLAQVSTGSADAMFTFETAVTKSLMTDPNVTAVYNSNQDFGRHNDQATLWQNVLVCRTDHGLTRERTDAFVRLLAESAAIVAADPQAADRLAVERLQADPGVYADAFGSGRLKFAIAPVDDKVRKEISAMIQLQQQAGKMDAVTIPDSYLGGL
jgi:ABC-type nitrate/sulfonate/bicarbonate transport system substrate-binding protein